MNPVVIAVIVVIIIGLVMGIMLSVASKFLAVPVDERVEAVRDCLPGANCGACGYAGCDAYAEAVVADPAIGANLCIPGGGDAASGIAAALGVEAGKVVPMMAHVKCNGTKENTEDKFDWLGDKTCSGAKIMFGSKNSCAYGCIGFGDCAEVCPEEAIQVFDGVARVAKDFCIGCGKCAKTCPNGVIEMIPKAANVRIFCNNKDKGKAAMQVCKVSCIACGKCAKTCENEAVVMENNVPVFDYDKNIEPAAAVIECCPRNCLR